MISKLSAAEPWPWPGNQLLVLDSVLFALDFFSMLIQAS